MSVHAIREMYRLQKEVDHLKEKLFMKMQCDKHSCKELLCGCPVTDLEQACSISSGQCDNANCETMQKLLNDLNDLRKENAVLRKELNRI